MTPVEERDHEEAERTAGKLLSWSVGDVIDQAELQNFVRAYLALLTEHSARETLRELAEEVRTLTEAPGNELPDAVFNLMAAILALPAATGPAQRKGAAILATESCPCGAVFTTTTFTMTAREKELDRFREAHRICRERYSQASDEGKAHG